MLRDRHGRGTEGRMGHEHVGALQRSPDGVAGGPGIGDEGSTHPVSGEADLICPWVAKQALVLRVIGHACRGEVERVRREREAFAIEQRMEPAGCQERDVVSAIGQTIRGLHERRHIAEVGGGRNHDSGHEDVLRADGPRRHPAASPGSGRRSVEVVEEVDDGRGLLAEHDLPDDLHVGPPVRLGGVSVAGFDQLDEAPLGPDAPASDR